MEAISGLPDADNSGAAPVERRSILLRGYVETPSESEPQETPWRQTRSEFVLFFDTETKDDASQQLRFGCYELWNRGLPSERGIFYEPDVVKPSELDVLGNVSASRSYRLMTRVDFVDRFFYPIAKAAGTIVGFNLPFDISRLAIGHDTARTVPRKDGTVDRSMQGGFTFKLSNKQRNGNVRVKHLSRRAAFMNISGVERNLILDLRTLGAALTGQSHTLKSLAKALDTDTPKAEFTDFARDIDEEFVSYAIDDVRVTRECYEKLIIEYDKHGLTQQTPPTRIYSEASLGKAYLQAMNIRPWRQVQTDFPNEILGAIMSSYFGGRAEVHRRREVVPTVYADFASMYPSVCTLQGLWKFAIAVGVDHADATAEAENFLADIGLSALQDPAGWKLLPVLVKVMPDADIFPVRAQYGNDAVATIAQDWFFSYRRLFGDVDLSHRDNPNLVEKAGREGFRQNRAYRQLVVLLEELFKRLAFDFFRERARLSTDFDELRRVRQHEHHVLQSRARRVSQVRNEFNTALERFFEEARAKTFSQRCDQISAEFNRRLDAIDRQENALSAGELLLRLERDFDVATRDATGAVTIARPRQFGLNKRQKQDWEAYSRERARLIEADLQPLVTSVSNRIRELTASGRAQVDPRRRLDEPVRRESETAISAVYQARNRANAALAGLDTEVKRTLNRVWSELGTRVEEVRATLAKTEIATLAPNEIERRRDVLINDIRETADRSTQIMQALSEQLSSIIQGLGEEGSLLEVAAVLESENDDLKERVDQYADLAQTGLALGLVQHEFAGQVRNINRGLEALKPWADRNKGLEELYGRLRVSFEHLESYLQLFVPLNRRLQRERVKVIGAEIEDFIRTVFGPRLERHDVKLEVSPAFKRATIFTYPSTIFPVFVNVVDNAVFWLSQIRRQSSKIITFDVRHNKFIIANNGPGIDLRDAERMFEFGVTTKPNGRGMGLYLSREALRKEGMDISLELAGLDVSPRFIIDAPAETIMEDQ